MSSTPELSSMAPSLIGASSAWTGKSGTPASTAAAPAELSKVLREIMEAFLRFSDVGKPVQSLFAGFGFAVFLVMDNAGARRLDSRGKIQPDRVADAAQRRKLQRHAEDAVHHLIDRGLLGAIASAARRTRRAAAEAVELMNADRFD